MAERSTVPPTRHDDSSDEPSGDEPSSAVTRLLREVSRGRADAYEELLPLVYHQLRSRAAQYLRRERGGHTLQPTALVNEAYLRLAGQHSIDWQNRAHFLAVAAQAMRRILIDWARSQHRAKRGGVEARASLDEVEPAVEGRPIDLLALDEALDRLAQLDERQARIVELRYFAGLTNEEVGEALGISSATVRRDWTFAKAWLRHQLTPRPSRT